MSNPRQPLIDHRPSEWWQFRYPDFWWNVSRPIINDRIQPGLRR